MTDDKIVSRWMPRLNDASDDVKEEAAEKLAAVASKNPQYREQIVPVLLDVCRKSDRWPVVVGGILWPTEDIPKQDARWLDDSVDVYIYLAKKNDLVIGEKAWLYIWLLIKENHLDETHSKFAEILEMAQRAQLREEGDVRKWLYSITDWHEDRQ